MYMKNKNFRRNNFISFMFMMFVVFMIAMPNITPKKFNHNVKNDTFLPVTFPWSIEINKLSLINCVNYAPNTDATINIKINGNKNDFAKETMNIEAANQQTFFVNELKSFNDIKSKKGNITIESTSKNIYCYVNYYIYDDDDNINGIYSLTNNDITTKNSYLINNKNIYGKDVEQIELYIHNLSNKDFNANIHAYSKNGVLKKSYNLSNLKPNDDKVIRIKNKSNMIYHIVPSNNYLKYITYLKITLKDNIIIAKPLTNFSKSNLLPITSKIYIGNISQDDASVTATLYTNSNKKIVKDFEIAPYTFKSYNFKAIAEEKDLKSIKLTSSSDSIIAFTKRKNQFIPFKSEDKLNSTDILLGYNLSLGEKSNLDVINNNDKTVEANIYINSNGMKKIVISPFSKVTLKLNKFLNKKNLIGYIYISSNENISAKLNTVLYKRLEYTNSGQPIADVTFGGIEKPEYIIK